MTGRSSVLKKLCSSDSPKNEILVTRPNLEYVRKIWPVKQKLNVVVAAAVVVVIVTAAGTAVVV